MMSLPHHVVALKTALWKFFAPFFAGKGLDMLRKFVAPPYLDMNNFIWYLRLT